MNAIPRQEIPNDILRDSILAHIAAAYFSVGKRLERKTQCSATRGFILSALRNGTVLNQNQIATLLAIDRTVVHRAVKLMVKEGLLVERKGASGKEIPVSLTAKGRNYRERLIKTRVAADEALRQQMTAEEREIFLRLLRRAAECKF
ncbi:MAG TPA: MarR family winged helix-turn-helix transcriptional regulator [Acidobacteriaceae bacterium]|nr:MarR family winged helix-turn-helix transcriptional regulator [Acidobacteriaceae bacterium]